MKNNLKKILAVVISAACMLTAMPISGFASEPKKIIIDDGTFTVIDHEGKTPESLKAFEGDSVNSLNESGRFFVTVNETKAENGYGEELVDGLKEAKDDSEKSGNVYYNSFKVPSAPKGYKDGAEISVKKNDDFYKAEDSFKNGNNVNLKYEPIAYKIIFDLNGGTSEIGGINAKYDEEIKLPSAENVKKDGYILNGWNTSADGNGTKYEVNAAVKNLSDKDGEEITLFAQWTKKDSSSEDNTTEDVKPEEKLYTIEFYLNNTGSYTYLKEFAEGDVIILPDAPIKVGFNFAGWILGEENGNVIPLPEKMPAKNLKAYASWELKEVKINYTVDGNNYSSKSAKYGSDIGLTIPVDPEKDGYTFAGWYDKNGDNVHDYSTVPADEVTFEARWLKNGNVVYRVDKKTYKAYEVTEGEKIPVPENPKKFGQKFKGWNPKVPEIMGNEDLVFNAEWEIDKTFVTVVIGGTAIAGGVVTAIIGAGAAAITGISIIGGIIALLGITSGINKSYTVTYKVDGKIYKTYKVTAGSKIPTPSDPVKTGCKFEGWAPSIPDKMPKQNLTFEAKWSELSTNKPTGSVTIPSTGSGIADIAAFSAIALSAAALLILKKKKK